MSEQIPMPPGFDLPGIHDAMNLLAAREVIGLSDVKTLSAREQAATAVALWQAPLATERGVAFAFRIVAKSDKEWVTEVFRVCPWDENPDHMEQ